VLPFNTNDLGVNILAQVAATAALSTKAEWFPRIKSITRANQAIIKGAVEKVPGAFLPLYPSQANMFAIDLAKTEVTPEALQKELLLRHGVFVRAGNYLSPKFGSRFVRVSFSNPPAEVERFAAAFPEAMAALRARPVAAS
jgi:aspartate/methionine/tyrosine aminotransferase